MKPTQKNKNRLLALGTAFLFLMMEVLPSSLAATVQMDAATGQPHAPEISVADAAKQNTSPATVQNNTSLGFMMGGSALSASDAEETDTTAAEEIPDRYAVQRNGFDEFYSFDVRPDRVNLTIVKNDSSFHQFVTFDFPGTVTNREETISIIQSIHDYYQEEMPAKHYWQISGFSGAEITATLIDKFNPDRDNFELIRLKETSPDRYEFSSFEAHRSGAVAELEVVRESGHLAVYAANFDDDRARILETRLYVDGEFDKRFVEDRLAELETVKTLSREELKRLGASGILHYGEDQYFFAEWRPNSQWQVKAPDQGVLGTSFLVRRVAGELMVYDEKAIQLDNIVHTYDTGGDGSLGVTGELAQALAGLALARGSRSGDYYYRELFDRDQDGFVSDQEVQDMYDAFDGTYLKNEIVRHAADIEGYLNQVKAFYGDYLPEVPVTIYWNIPKIEFIFNFENLLNGDTQHRISFNANYLDSIHFSATSEQESYAQGFMTTTVPPRAYIQTLTSFGYRDVPADIKGGAPDVALARTIARARGSLANIEDNESIEIERRADGGWNIYRLRDGVVESTFEGEPYRFTLRSPEETAILNYLGPVSEGTQLTITQKETGEWKVTIGAASGDLLQYAQDLYFDLSRDGTGALVINSVQAAFSNFDGRRFDLSFDPEEPRLNLGSEGQTVSVDFGGLWTVNLIGVINQSVVAYEFLEQFGGLTNNIRLEPSMNEGEVFAWLEVSESADTPVRSMKLSIHQTESGNHTPGTLFFLNDDGEVLIAGDYSSDNQLTILSPDERGDLVEIKDVFLNVPVPSWIYLDAIRQVLEDYSDGRFPQGIDAEVSHFFGPLAVNLYDARGQEGDARSSTFFRTNAATGWLGAVFSGGTVSFNQPGPDAVDFTGPLVPEVFDLSREVRALIGGDYPNGAFLSVEEAGVNVFHAALELPDGTRTNYDFLRQEDGSFLYLGPEAEARRYLDQDGNGLISDKEAVGGYLAFMASEASNSANNGDLEVYDFNRDGLINHDDRAAILNVIEGEGYGQFLIVLNAISQADGGVISGQAAVKAYASLTKDIFKQIPNSRNDFNRDGRVDNQDQTAFLSLIGLTAYQPEIRAFRAFDANRDGQITQAEAFEAYDRFKATPGAADNAENLRIVNTILEVSGHDDAVTFYEEALDYFGEYAPGQAEVVKRGTSRWEVTFSVPGNSENFFGASRIMLIFDVRSQPKLKQVFYQTENLRNLQTVIVRPLQIIIRPDKPGIDVMTIPKDEFGEQITHERVVFFAMPEAEPEVRILHTFALGDNAQALVQEIIEDGQTRLQLVVQNGGETVNTFAIESYQVAGPFSYSVSNAWYSGGYTTRQMTAQGVNGEIIQFYSYSSQYTYADGRTYSYAQNTYAVTENVESDVFGTVKKTTTYNLADGLHQIRSESYARSVCQQYGSRSYCYQEALQYSYYTYDSAGHRNSELIYRYGPNGAFARIYTQIAPSGMTISDVMYRSAYGQVTQNTRSVRNAALDRDQGTGIVTSLPGESFPN